MKIDGLPEQAKTAYKFDNIQDPLISISVLCDNGCTVIFTKQSVHVNKDRKTILTGYREPFTKLWIFPHAENTPPAGQQVEPRINEILPDRTMSDTLNFLHRSMGSPTKNTLLNTIQKIICLRGHYSLRTTSPSFYQIQYPQHWGTKIGHRKTHIIINNQCTKHRKISTSTSTQKSTSQKCPQGRYTPTKTDNLPTNQAVGTNI